MKVRFVSGVAACLAASSRASAESAGFALMRQLCIEPRANAGAGLSVADTAGFFVPSLESRSKILKDFSSLGLQTPDVRGRFLQDGSPQILVVGKKPANKEDPIPFSSATFDVCVVVAKPDPLAEEEFVAWAGVARDKDVTRAPAFEFFGDGPHHPVVGATEREVTDAARSGQLQIATIEQEPGATVMVYGRSRP